MSTVDSSGAQQRRFPCETGKGGGVAVGWRGSEITRVTLEAVTEFFLDATEKRPLYLGARIYGRDRPVRPQKKPTPTNDAGEKVGPDPRGPSEQVSRVNPTVPQTQQVHSIESTYPKSLTEGRALLLGSTGFYWVLLGLTVFDWVWPSLTELSTVFRGF